MTSVLLATDGSEDARQAAERAIDLAEERGARLHVIGVIDDRRLGEPALSASELATIFAADDVADSVADVREQARDRGISVKGLTRHGTPHEVIISYAETVDAETIVIGEHGNHEANFSGVGRRVRDVADCDVVVVGRDSPAVA